MQVKLRLALVTALVAGVASWGASAAAAPSETYDDLTVLLQRHVDERGLVDYRGWKERDEAALRAVVTRLEGVDLAAWSDSQRDLKAYWINVYNAVTLQAVLERFPLRSIRDAARAGETFNVWDDYPFRNGGRTWSLNQIEHELLRPMGDPRIHAAVNCASLGCPPLRREAFVAARLDEQLDDQTRAWLNDPARGVRVRDGLVALSELFSWFGDDFAPDPAGRLRWISRYLRDPAMREAVSRRGARLESIPWDWGLNQRP